MKNEQINEMWKEIGKLNFTGTKAIQYRCEFMTKEQIDAINDEYHQWCKRFSKENTCGGWSACMAGSFSRDAMDDIIKKHTAKNIVPISVDGRRKLMKKVMDTAEKLLASFGLKMPHITWLAFGSHTVYRDKIRLSALDFMERNVEDTDETVFERCMDMFCSYVYFCGKGVKEYFDAHGLTYTKRTGKDYKAWKKMVLDKMKKKETKAKEKKEEGEKTKEKITVKKVSIANSVATCYAELVERVLMHDYCDVGVKDFWRKDTTRFRVDFELYDGGDTVVPRNVRVYGQLPYSCLCSGTYMTDCGKLDEHKNWTWYDTCYKQNLDYGKEVENYQIRYLDFVSHKVIEKMLKAIKQPKRYDKAYEYTWMVDFSK